MDYRILGRTGVRIAPLALGTDNFLNPTPEPEAAAIIDRAVDAGINLIDTSDSYAHGECERIIGRALAHSGTRNQVILATKAYYPTGPDPNDQSNSRLHLIRACEDSLRRLNTDHIDLFQIHRPSFDIPVDETLGALTDLVRQGKVRYIGSSTAPAWKLMESLLVSEAKGYARFVSEQPPYNLLDRRIENELVPLCRAYNVALLPWSPLAMGILAGRYMPDCARPADSRAALRGGIYAERITDRAIQVGNNFVQLARSAGLSPSLTAILWLKDQPGVTAPLLGPRSLDQLEHLLPALEMTLDETFRAACDELVPPGSAVANFHNSSGWMKMRE
jgi:1-deoxyxylulose-5-phosphate synthase